ncbi:hypothetical protein DVH24_013092 [Malus domestica]|uniref:Uncharacterized protein n=1 Tax=Malus domestica TaxID=3750 RepID=A0A498IP78_MALDO|nr:hypothetical protein DVH24_013092 [Malus domestica]
MLTSLLPPRTEDIGSFELYKLETIVGRITKHEEDHEKNIASLKRKLKKARRPMEKLVVKQIKKFMSSDSYNHALAEQYKQGFRSGLSEGFEIFHRYAMKVDVNKKWATIDYYKALAVGATHQE